MLMTLIYVALGLIGLGVAVGIIALFIALIKLSAKTIWWVFIIIAILGVIGGIVCNGGLWLVILALLL